MTQIMGFGNTQTSVRKSLVLVYFPSIDRSYSYFNDRFELKKGDLVFVEGNLYDTIGEVKEISYSFKIKLSNYKRIRAVLDTNISGEFFSDKNYYITYDLSGLNYEKVVSWLIPPEDEVFEEEKNGEFFSIFDLEKLGAAPEIIKRGEDYFKNDRVLFLEASETAVRAIVAGEEYYTVEFERRENEIACPICSCYCFGSCKHEVAVILKLRELIEKFGNTPFSAISKPVFNRFVKPEKLVIE